MTSPHILTPHAGFAGVFPPSKPTDPDPVIPALRALGFPDEEISKLKSKAINIVHPGFFRSNLSEAARRKAVIEFFSLPEEDRDEEPPTNHGRWNTLVDQARTCDMIAVAQTHGAQLRKSGHGGEFVGACLICGTGDDRFAINPRKEVFNCRGCGKGGRGPIDLEMFLSGCEFAEAVKRLTNATSLGTPRRSTPAQRERENEQYEARQHQKASWLWARRQPAAGSPVERYLSFRGYVDAIPPTIGYLPARGEHPHAMISAYALPNEIEPGELGAPLVVRSVHITKLAPDGSDRIREEGAKIIVGRPLGLPIAISCIIDGLSLAITEGVEDALAYRAAGFAAWAAGSAPFIPALADSIPDYVTTIIIEQHPDQQAEHAVARLQALLRERPIRENERPINVIIREAGK
jgi:CHC2-type zinc finger protein